MSPPLPPRTAARVIDSAVATLIYRQVASSHWELQAAYGRVQNLFGLDSVDLISLTDPLLALADPMDAQNYRQTVLTGLQSGLPWKSELALNMQGSSQRCLQIVVCPNDSVQNRVWYCTVSDCTQSRQALADLRSSDARFRAMFDKAYVGMAIGTPDGRILAANDSLARMLERSRDELVGMHIGEFTHPDDVVTEKIYLDEVRANQRDDFRITKRYITKSGAHLPVDLLVTVIRDDLGNPTSVVGMVIDLTERFKVESELRLAAITFESNEGILITDPALNILKVNKSFEKTLGYRPDEVIGKHPRMLGSGQHPKVFYEVMWESIQSRGMWRGEIWNKRKDGHVFPEDLTITAVKNSEGVVVNYVGVFSDISSKKAATSKIEKLASFDTITGLPNRRLLIDRLTRAQNRSVRNLRHGALLVVDGDHFRKLNDTMGHELGDQLLVQMAARLGQHVRETDTVARIGADQFAIVVEDFEDPDSAGAYARTVANSVLEAIRKPFYLHYIQRTGEHAEHVYEGSVSIGIVMFGIEAYPVDDLLKWGEAAMYHAKAAGRNTFCFHDRARQAAAEVRLKLEADMRSALKAGEFVVLYQPQYNDQNRIVGAECLIRWKHRTRGQVSPADFIPIAEESGAIVQIGQWVLETACDQLARWSNDPVFAGLSLAVNVSARQIAAEDYVETVRQTMFKRGAPAGQLKLEITEGVLLTNAEDVVSKINELKEAGCLFAIDDFGTGYSSLAYLRRLPIDQLKIDRAFVSDVLTNPHDAAIARVIVTLGASLDLDVIAEGVESDGQRAFLLENGCTSYQGFLFSRPIDITTLEALVHASNGDACS